MKKKFTEKEYNDFILFLQLIKKMPKYIASMGDGEGINPFSVEVMKNCQIDKDGNLYNKSGYLGEKCDNYFVNQKTGYYEDDYYGYIYFATPINGEYLQFSYDC